MKDPSPISLQDPDDLSLENAYRSLPVTGELIIYTSHARLFSMLEGLEKAGFAGMEIRPFGSAEEKITLRANKGKQGTCYDTGRSARYLGAALAALDDDYHLVFAGEEMPVCEKTATLYSLPSYRDKVSCSEANPVLQDKLFTGPEVFEGVQFEALQEKLFTKVFGKKRPDSFRDLIYPGPFKLLVLEDGTILHRGRVSRVPVGLAKKLIKSDDLFGYDGMGSGHYESFTELYRAEGPRCLLKKSGGNVISDQNLKSDFSALNHLSRDFSKRLKRTIESRKNYFMLTGSSREDEYGCCPSDEVTMADQLVRDGILSASRETAAPDACPVTIYAFRNELTSSHGDLQFSQDTEFRQEVLSRLKSHSSSLPGRFARWALLAFVAVTLVLAIIRISGTSVSPGDHGLFTRLEVSRPNSTALVLFHYNQRCSQCLAMEKYAREVLKDEFPGMLQRKQIQFRQVIMDAPGNRSLVDRFGLVTSTMVIIRFEGMEEDSIRVLDRSWALYHDEVGFKTMLTNELHHMIRAQDE